MVNIQKYSVKHLKSNCRKITLDIFNTRYGKQAILSCNGLTFSMFLGQEIKRYFPFSISMLMLEYRMHPYKFTKDELELIEEIVRKFINTIN